MTAQKAQIESLIQEIDEVLSKTAPRLPWIMSEEAAHQREVLEQTRRYLLSIQTQPPQEALPALPPSPEAVASEIPAANISHPTLPSNASPAPLLPSPPAPQPPTPHSPLPTPPVESAQQALQAIVQEMNYLRSNLLQPMRSDVDSLRRQREMLLQEIRQLEAQRQQSTLPQQNQLLMEFLQAAFRQMQDNLTAQVSQMMSTLGSQTAQTALPEGAANLSGTDLSGSQIAALSPAQRLEQIQRVQTQSDELLLKLDSSLRIIFNSLQQNVQTYEDSLEQGLSRMHNLGQQGEAMFSALVTRLAEQLGREASTFLQSSIEPGNWEPALPPEGRASGAGASEARSPKPAPQQPASKQSASPSTPQPTTATQPEVDQDIASLLSELNELDTAQPPQTINPFATDAQLEVDRLNADLNSLDLLDLELKQLDLDAIAPEPFAIVDEDLTVFQDDPISGILGADLTALQDISEPEVIESLETEFGQAETAIEPFIDPFAGENSDQAGANDASEVMDLLNQIEVDLTVGLAAPESTDLSADTIIEDPGSEVLSGNAAIDPFAGLGETAEPDLVDSPDSLYEDAFYQTLFGEAAAPPITAEDLFAENSVAETGEPPIAEASEPDAGTLTDIPLGRETQDDLFSTFSEAVPLSDELTIEELTIVEAPDLAQSVENVLLPPIDLQSPLPNRMPFAAQPAEAVSDRPVAEPDPTEQSELEQFSESFSESYSESSAGVNSADSPSSYSVSPEPFLEPSSEPLPEASSEPFSEPSSEAIETISSLMALIPFGSSAESFSEKSNLAGGSIRDSVNVTIAPATVTEPEFELAQPGEDLLADEPSQPDALLNFRLPAETLEQLAQDLSGLEGEGTQVRSQFTLADAEDWLMSDLPSEPSTNSFAEAQPLQFSNSPEAAPEVASDLTDSETAETIADWFDSESSASPTPTAGSSEFVIEPIDLQISDPLQFSPPSEEQSTGWDLFNDFADQSEAQPPETEKLPGIGETAATTGNVPNHATDPALDNASDDRFTLDGLETLFESLPPRQPETADAGAILFLDDLAQVSDPAAQTENRSPAEPAEPEDEKKKS